MVDAFVAKLNAAGSALVYSTYLGGSSADAGLRHRRRLLRQRLRDGATLSTDFPTVTRSRRPTVAGDV